MDGGVDLSVAIVSYHSLDLLKRCLSGWFPSIEGITAELIIVENGTGENVSSAVLPYIPDARVIPLSESIGFSVAINRALKEARGRYVAILNPDTLLHRESFARMVKYMEANAHVAVLGPRVWDDEGKTQIQRSWRSFPTLMTSLFNRYSLFSRLWPGNPWTRKYLRLDSSPDDIQECEWISGCCLMIRHSVFKECGGLDEAYPMYCEDVDLCRQVRRRGWSVVYFPHSSIVHYIGGSSRKVPLRSLWFRHRSMQHYVLKYGRWFNPLSWIIVMAIWARFGIAALALPLQKRARPTL